MAPASAPTPLLAFPAPTGRPPNLGERPVGVHAWPVSKRLILPPPATVKLHRVFISPQVSLR